MAVGDPEIAVITATIGHRFLLRALQSVQRQDYRNVHHLLVIDGPEAKDAVDESLAQLGAIPSNVSVLALPRCTGARGWCSHRIYAALPFLVDEEYVCFLDHDNWLESNHISALVLAQREHRARAAYSLRKIYDHAGEFICRDDCQSLGTLHESYDTPGKHHIDSSCWLVARSLAIGAATAWMMRSVGDRGFARQVMALSPELPCSMQYSLNYTAGNRAESVPGEFFIRGNAVMNARYPGGLPWADCGAPTSAREARSERFQ